MPFTDKPTMLMGIDLYQKIQRGKKKYVVGIVATIDRNFAKYVSDVAIEGDID